LLARLYGLKPDELDLERAPAQIVTFGISFLIAPVKSREIMERVQVDIPALHELHTRYGCDLLTAFCLDAYQRGSMASTRVFAPLHGVAEDPATGSSASCLAWYLRSHGLIPDCGADWLKLDQGYSVVRPSLIQLRANLQADGAIEVSIGGHVVPVARGEYVLP
jgi:trans-2,3-dihydro-3-hydroxyanthranilate isomerase